MAAAVAPGRREAGGGRRVRPTASRLPPPASLFKPVVFAAALAPGAFIGWQIWRAWLGEPNDLGANPIEEAEIRTGLWALRFLAITLALTPLRRLTGWNWLVKYRRMMGLFAFFYATAHLAIFFGLDIELQWGELLEGIVERPYITVGFLSWLLLVPLAITSTKGWVRRLGGKRWTRLHRLIYVIAVGGTVHYLWSVKKDLRPPLVYAAIFAALFAARLLVRRSAREHRAHPPRQLVERERLLEEVDPARR